MKMTTIMKPILVASMGVILVACDDDNTTTDQASIEFAAKNLENLGADYDYEGWLITPDGAKATGPFDIDNANKTATHTFKVDAADAMAATAFVLTIEPAGETGAAAATPSKVHVLAGDIVNNAADIVANDARAIGSDFSTAAGQYILAVPSATEADNAANTQGIWYINDGSAGLTLPKLNDGWKYEGWIVEDGTPLSTGTFLTANEADSDKGGETAGSNATPPYPGQDFINPAKDLVGKTAVISVEPDPDNSDAPFSLKPLVGVITNTAGQMLLENKAADSLPSATVSISVNKSSASDTSTK